MSHKKLIIDFRALRLIATAIIIVLAAIFLPLILRKCEQSRKTENSPPAYAPLFKENLESELENLGFSITGNEIYDEGYAEIIGELDIYESEGQFQEARIIIPFVYFEGAPEPGDDFEFEMFLASEKSHGIIERCFSALYGFADTGNAAPSPSLSSVMTEITKSMSKETPFAWTWNNLSFSAEPVSDFSGELTIIIDLSVLPEED